MATIKEKKLARELVKTFSGEQNLTGGQMLDKVGYSKGLQKHPNRVISQEGVQEELQVMGFTEEAAKGVVASILYHSDNDMARLKASDQIFKVLGSYAPTKSENINVNLNKEITPQEEEIAKKANEDLKKLYGEKET